MGVLGSIEVFGKGGGVEVLRYWGVLGSTGEKGMEGGIGRRMERYGWRMGSAASATSVREGGTSQPIIGRSRKREKGMLVGDSNLWMSNAVIYRLDWPCFLLQLFYHVTYVCSDYSRDRSECSGAMLTRIDSRWYVD